MSKMKKILAVILLVSLALMLTACSDGGEKKPADTGTAPAVTEAKETEVPAEAETTPAVTKEAAEAKETETPAEAAPAAPLAERVEAAIPEAADLAPFTADELLDMKGVELQDGGPLAVGRYVIRGCSSSLDLVIFLVIPSARSLMSQTEGVSEIKPFELMSKALELQNRQTSPREPHGCPELLPLLRAPVLSCQFQGTESPLSLSAMRFITVNTY